MFKTGFSDVSTYHNFGTFFLSFLIVVVALWLARFITNIPVWLKLQSELVYPMYLLHVPLGLGMMLYLKNYITNPYVLILISVLFVISISYLVHKFIEVPSIACGRSFIKKGYQK